MPDKNNQDDLNELLDEQAQFKTDAEVTEPKMYRVLIHNDHYTTMDFVIEVLIKVFLKPAAEATKLMLDVHYKGVGIAGIYPYDIAVTKTNQANQMARQRQFPLKCSYEPI